MMETQGTADFRIELYYYNISCSYEDDDYSEYRMAYWVALNYYYNCYTFFNERQIDEVHKSYIGATREITRWMSNYGPENYINFCDLSMIRMKDNDNINYEFVGATYEYDWFGIMWDVMINSARFGNVWVQCKMRYDHEWYQKFDLYKETDFYDANSSKTINSKGHIEFIRTD